MLILRLCASPTYYQVEASSTIFFSDEGPVGFLLNSNELGLYLRKEPAAWALFDSTLSFKEPPGISPHPHLLSRALDACRANLRVCDHLLHAYNADLFNSASFQRRPHNEQKFCKKYGSSARDAYGSASETDQFEQDLRAYCGGLSYEKAGSDPSLARCQHYLRHPHPKSALNILSISPQSICFTVSILNSGADAAAKFINCSSKTERLKLRQCILEPAVRHILGHGGSFDIIRLEDSQA